MAEAEIAAEQHPQTEQLAELQDAYDGTGGRSFAPVDYGRAGSEPIQTHGNNAINDMVDDHPEFDPADMIQARQFVRFYRDKLTGDIMVSATTPGDETAKMEEVAGPHHVRRWPKQWAAFNRNAADFEGQTMLNDVDWLGEGTVFMLQGRGVRTVEQLAMVSDSNSDNLGLGGRQMRDRARLETAKKLKMQKAMTAAEELEEQRKVNADLQDRLAKLEAKAK